MLSTYGPILREQKLWKNMVRSPVVSDRSYIEVSLLACRGHWHLYLSHCAIRDKERAGRWYIAESELKNTHLISGSRTIPEEEKSSTLMETEMNERRPPTSPLVCIFFLETQANISATGKSYEVLPVFCRCEKTRKILGETTVAGREVPHRRRISIPTCVSSCQLVKSRHLRSQLYCMLHKTKWLLFLLPVLISFS